MTDLDLLYERYRNDPQFNAMVTHIYTLIASTKASTLYEWRDAMTVALQIYHSTHVEPLLVPPRES